MRVGQKCASFPPDQSHLCFWGLFLMEMRFGAGQGTVGLAELWAGK